MNVFKNLYNAFHGYVPLNPYSNKPNYLSGAHHVPVPPQTVQGPHGTVPYVSTLSNQSERNATQQYFNVHQPFIPYAPQYFLNYNQQGLHGNPGYAPMSSTPNLQGGFSPQQAGTNLNFGNYPQIQIMQQAYKGLSK